MRALTHASVDNTTDIETYERLEFLGDRVLGLVVCDFLMRTYTLEDEGALSRRLSGLVDRSTLATVAKSIEMEDYIIYGAGTRLNESILADVIEALFGAVYRDGGLEKARPVIEELVCSLAEEVQAPPTDSKTTLQEWAQGQKLGLPVYREIGRDGPDHQPVFSVEVVVTGLDPCQANGSSKRNAEQAAAAEMLKKISASEDD
ncbi:MAG: ribonuclease III [Rhodospirillaceae bacterium]|nr:ribonuclease III [Rhodospirillaceae bacterium]